MNDEEVECVARTTLTGKESSPQPLIIYLSSKQGDRMEQTILRQQKTIKSKTPLVFLNNLDILIFVIVFWSTR